MLCNMEYRIVTDSTKELAEVLKLIDTMKLSKDITINIIISHGAGVTIKQGGQQDDRR